MIKRSLTSSFVLLAACGGADTTSDTSWVQTTPTSNSFRTSAPASDPVALADTDLSQAQDITFVSLTEEGEGSFVPSLQEAQFSGETFAAIDSAVNDNLNYVKLLDNAAVALVEPTGTLPTGAATYNGAAVVQVSDGAGSVYEGNARATIALNFQNQVSGDIRLYSFVGTQTNGLNITDHNSGTLIFDDVRVVDGAFTEIGDVTASGFGDTEFVNPSTQRIAGQLAGPNAIEAGGTLEVSGTESGSSVIAGFAGARRD